MNMINKAWQHQHRAVREAYHQAEAYALEYRGENPRAHYFNSRIRRVAELCQGFNRGRILDIGCGPAIVGELFRGKPIEYHGVDISEDMIEVCHERYGHDPQFHFSLQMAEELEFADASFGMVFCLGVLEYVIDPELAIREATRVLRPGGALIATTLNRMSPYELWERLIYVKYSLATRKILRLLNRGTLKPAPTEASGAMRPLTRLLGERAFRTLMMSGGLRIEDMLTYSFRLFPPPLDALFPRGSVFVSRNLEFLCRSQLRFLGQGIMVKCKKAPLISRP